MTADIHRPRYHFTAPQNWINDPNGLIHWRGEYHMFYQHNPSGAFWGDMHWGHAVSTDLVHWTHLPIALAPTPGGVDQDGVFSGCAVVHNDMPVIVYTGVRGEQQLPCVAFGDATLRTLTKHTGNPVIAAPPAGVDWAGFRDHTIWREHDGLWYQGIGAGIRNTAGTVLLYRSADLLAWEYVGMLCSGDYATTGDMWECPDFFALGEQHVLLISPLPQRATFAMVGTYAQHQFTPDRLDPLDHGRSFYAPQTFSDAHGRRIMIGWLQEERDDASQRAAGWSGAMAVPRVLSLNADGSLQQQPAPELEQLRGRHEQLRDIGLGADQQSLLTTVTGAALELALTIEPGDAREVVVTVLRSPDGVEETRIVIAMAENRLRIDRSRASSASNATREPIDATLPMVNGEVIHLRIFVDRSIVEVFAGDRTVVAARVYPTHTDSTGVMLSALGGSARVTQFDAWEMAAV